MYKKLRTIERVHLGLLALASLAIISISPYFLGPGKFGITPIYIWFAANVGIHPLLIGIILLVLIWLALGILSAKVTYRVLILWNFATTLIGLSWLIRSKDYIIPDFSTAYFIWCVIAFTLIQGNCWFFGLKFKRAEGYDRSRAICSILITLNVCWTLMPYYGIK